MSNKLFWVEDGSLNMSGKNVLILLTVGAICFASGWYGKPKETKVVEKVVHLSNNTVDFGKICANFYGETLAKAEAKAYQDVKTYWNGYFEGYSEGNKRKR